MKKSAREIKTEVQLVEEMLIREGFTKITASERRSPEFRDSLKEFDVRRKNFKAKTKSTKKK